ncbi:mitogen-activated protein kinase kinase [Caenorhabditis elegans]|uniref:mitogen-activated protein kinase kinase n=1 Tax=Caenorhabditis elegans TaxID=6239 RepID=A0A8D9MJ97_CAEEL|nr:Protein kinase domain-containing protein [Caenorhabditis elegans]CAG8860268.1 Protein kinase domain-containing protein [Caenorhabditis elegans]
MDHGDDQDFPMFARPVFLANRPTLESLSSNDGSVAEENPLRSMSTGILKFPDDAHLYPFNHTNLRHLSQVGAGYYGTVHKMQHNESGRLIAVKKIRYNNICDQTRLLKEHDTHMKSENVPNIVKFFGACFSEGDCWICMELMDISIDFLYKRVYSVKKSRLNENIIGHITVCIVDALDYLKRKLNRIHRDVKPSNILINAAGDVKLCDFGICGDLVGSYAITVEAGCVQYLAPERIENMDKYDIRSDVWSLGITLYEIATGVYPYRGWSNQMEHIEIVVNGDSPILLQNMHNLHYTDPLCRFINTWYAVGGPDIEEAKRILGLEAIDARDHPVEQRA